MKVPPGYGIYSGHSVFCYCIASCNLHRTGTSAKQWQWNCNKFPGYDEKHKRTPALISDAENVVADDSAPGGYKCKDSSHFG